MKEDNIFWGNINRSGQFSEFSTWHPRRHKDCDRPVEGAELWAGLDHTARLGFL